MALERTLSIVKPDGVSRNLIGEVYRRFEKAGLSIIAARMLHLSQREAEGFYAVHRERPFFKDLVKYMTSGPVVVQVLEGESAIAKNREPECSGRNGAWAVEMAMAVYHAALSGKRVSFPLVSRNHPLAPQIDHSPC